MINAFLSFLLSSCLSLLFPIFPDINLIRRSKNIQMPKIIRFSRYVIFFLLEYFDKYRYVGLVLFHKNRQNCPPEKEIKCLRNIIFHLTWIELDSVHLYIIVPIRQKTGIQTLSFFSTNRNPRLYRIIGKFPHLCMRRVAVAISSRFCYCQTSGNSTFPDFVLLPDVGQ